MALAKIANSGTNWTSSTSAWATVIIGEELYVSNYLDSNIKVYNLSDKSLLRTLSVIGGTKSIGTDGSNLLVKNTSSYIMTVDKTTGEVLSTKNNVDFSTMAGNSASFYVDIENDLIYIPTYNSTVEIRKYTNGTLANSITGFQMYTVGAFCFTKDNHKYLVITSYSNNRIYYTEITGANATLLTFSHFNSVTIGTDIVGGAYYNDTIFYGTYANNSIYTVPITYVLGKKCTDIENVNTQGDYISCECSATSNTIGQFSNLGTATKPLIPISSSPTPNGSFYWIFVGYDHSGRKKFIADRNIQSGITWDNINKSGIISGINISIDNNTKYKYEIRLLSGGISSADKDNEWDKIICESTLNGKITAGDNSIWNWSGISSWTSTSGATNTNRVIRGNGSASARSEIVSSTTTATSTGFRPILLVETLAIYKYFIQTEDNAYYSFNTNTNQWISSGTELTESDILDQGMSTINQLTNAEYQLVPHDKFRVVIFKISE